jgi:hypothetical protein
VSVVAVSRELGLPVKLVGVGEGIEDLKDVSKNDIRYVTIFIEISVLTITLMLVLWICLHKLFKTHTL